ncbi:GGDEF domain-containing protein [Candidatus Laterigemmans baculatus]|uniref:GGDEF domain-containing protein n=1 Tax=Candidatus Laterigemmans baculatus TaxID=2770505 RepID=UPI0013D9E3A5|nr:GGDEF domain-containing protein [Candidatus Laterigemmans baculatus]
MIVDVLVALSCGLVGLMCGWLIYPTLNSTDPESDEPPGAPPATAASTQDERERLTQIAARVRTLNARVAADVDAHQSRIREVNEALSEVDLQNEPELILEAMSRLLDASEKMRDQLEQAEDRLQEQNLQLQTAEQRAMTDSLTRLANRRALDEHLQARAELRGSEPTTMMLFDIDHFKDFNDSYGHLAGDEVLRVVAKMVQARAQEECLVARYGGEEFAVVFDGKTLDDCRLAAEQIRAAIGHREILFAGKRLRVTASAGLAEHYEDESVEEWISRTDKALYASKAADRNCLHSIEGDQPVLFLPPPEEPILKSRRATKETAEEASEPLTAHPKNPSASLPDYLQRLPSGKRLETEFGEMLTGLSGVGVSFVTAVVRIDDEAADTEQLQLVARTARKVLRSVDRIGILDHRTLVIGMPSVDRESAVLRGDDLRSTLAHHDESNPRLAGMHPTVTVSMASSREAASFPQMLSLAVQTLEQAATSGSDQTVARWDLESSVSAQKTS